MIKERLLINERGTSMHIHLDRKLTKSDKIKMRTVEGSQSSLIFNVFLLLFLLIHHFFESESSPYAFQFKVSVNRQKRIKPFQPSI